jgi:hypothetical protein
LIEISGQKVVPVPVSISHIIWVIVAILCGLIGLFFMVTAVTFFKHTYQHPVYVMTSLVFIGLMFMMLFGDHLSKSSKL